LRHHVVITTVPYGGARIESIAIFASSTAQHGSDPGGSGGIVSSFRLICIAALTVAMVVFVVEAAAAQSATAGQAYLAGLRPPHEHPQAAHGKTSRSESPRKPATKSPQQAAKRQPSITAKSRMHHRPVRLAEKINSRVAWPSAEPTAADQPATSETVLQFATEDATSGSAAPVRTPSIPAAAAHSAMPASAASAAKTAPPVNIATTDQHDSADPVAADKPQANPQDSPQDNPQNNPQDTTAVVQTQRLEAPASRPMRVIAPALSEAPLATSAPSGSAPSDQPAVRSQSSTAQMLATLAGAIAACIVAFVMFGFGSARIRQI
jgi:hypothetical protein